MTEKSLKRNAVFNVLKTIISLLFPLITFPYASRILMPIGIGKINFSNSIISYFGIIASLGISTYGIREAAKRKHDKILLSQFTFELFVLNLISTFIAYILLFVAIFFIPKFIEYRTILIVCSTTIIFTTIGIDWLYSALEEYGYIAIRSVLFQILSIILLFSFVKTPDDYIKYAAISVVSSVGANICNIFHARKFLSFKSLKKINIKQHVKPVLIFFGSTLAISVFTILDTSMLGFLCSDTEVGYYSAATKLIRMIRDLFPAVFTVMFARLSIYANDEDKSDKFVSLIKNMLNFICFMGFPIIVGLFLLGRPIINLLSGSAYLPALPTMYIMLPVILLSSTAGFLGGTVLNSLGKEKIYLYCVIIGAIINFTLNSILIRLFGAFGAGFATLITEFILMILYFIFLRKIIQFKVLFIQILQSISASLIMGGIIFLLKNIINSEILQLIILTCVGMCVYLILMVLFKNSLATELKKIIQAKIKR